jgi:hypothetical protein
LHTKKKRKIKLILFGGLGNQLFQYFAGQYLANKSGANLKIDSTFSQFGRSGHSDWIGETTLPGNISMSAPRHSFRHLDSLLKKLTREFLARVIKGRDMQLKILHQYHSPAPGYDPQLEQLKPSVTIRGYFQTWRYFEDLKNLGLVPEIKMKRPSRWFLEMTDQMNSQGRVLGIHVRRGDYVGNGDIGTLSQSYYDVAVEELRSRGVTWDAVWIFSDDILLAQNEFKEFSNKNDNTVFLEPPTGSHSFESMLLLSGCSSLIIANSTFSWWAPTLGNPEKTVVCPSKWFAGMEDPRDLCPPKWIQVTSSWANLETS